ncbi:MAG TPA: RDD family protein [Chloroflexota bacterium]|nr:RDD family protein [Chloroflexota bacterium]
MASADYTVLTPERVSLQYDIAGIGSRGAAALVDTALQVVALTVLIFAGTAAYILTNSSFGGGFGARGATGAAALLLGLYALATLLVTAGYFMLFEILWSGQTPGKRVVGVRVIRENGYPIRPIDAVIRNLVRMVDWLPFIYGIGVVTMLLNTRSKRLGDYASGTIVVREGARGPVAMPAVSDGQESRGFELSNQDATLVRDFLLRRGAMHPRARTELAQRLAQSLAQRYSLPLESTPEAFLERLTSA